MFICLLGNPIYGTQQLMMSCNVWAVLVGGESVSPSGRFHKDKNSWNRSLLNECSMSSKAIQITGAYLCSCIFATFAQLLREAVTFNPRTCLMSQSPFKSPGITLILRPYRPFGLHEATHPIWVDSGCGPAY